MEANARSINFLNQTSEFIVPYFQRGYVWDKTNWEELFAGFESSERNFLGSLVFKHLKHITGEIPKILVIDGQQRLTTLSILIKALYDSFPTEIRRNVENNLRLLLFYKKDQTSSTYDIKIQHSRIDSHAFKNVIKLNFDSDDDQFLNSDSSKIVSCYKHFLSRLKERTVDENKKIFNRLLNESFKILVVIDLDDSEDEQQIFDTINSSGVHLDPSDIIKNALFQEMISGLKDQKKVEEFYSKYWESTFLSDEDSIEFWGKEKVTGRIKRNNLQVLFHSIAIIKKIYNADENNLSDLSNIYKEYFGKLKTESEYKIILEEIKDYGTIYEENLLTNVGAFSYTDYEKRLFYILNTLEITTFHPFLLFLYKNRSDDKEKYFKDLELFVIRRMIADVTTKNYNKLCIDFISNPDIIRQEMITTTEQDIKKGLHNISNKSAKVLLFLIELYRRSNDNRFDQKSLADEYTLEHIMPQKWNQHWTSIPSKQNPDGSPMTAEEAKQDRKEKIYWIGNMTLLTGSLNSSLRNFNFEKKMNGEGRKKGIKDYASLVITRDDIVTPFLNGNTVWDESSIEKRTKDLTEEILEIWKL
jgi:uncharacterized protein with ParB-like and HNH nuclease domain